MLHNTDETMKIAAAGAEKLGMKPYYLYRQKNMSGNLDVYKRQAWRTPVRNANGCDDFESPKGGEIVLLNI